jgi:hypothetical protein
MRLLSVLFLALIGSCSVFGQSYTINTVAGGGLPVNIPAISASLSANLNQHNSVAVDAGGNVYLASSAANIVLRLDAQTGLLTLADGN